MIKKDIIIVGGGASGMMCAIKAKEKNPKKSVAILEKQNRIGRKLLSTGNGRCNLYNIDCNNTEHYSGSFVKNLKSFIKACSIVKFGEEFSKLGLITYSDNEGRGYPYSNHASSVLDTLRYRINDLNIDVICNNQVISIQKKEEGFTVFTDDNKYFCKKLVISSGTPASPKLGSDRSGIDILSKTGHKIVELSPALCPLEVVDTRILSSFKGVRQKGFATLFDGDKYIKTENGEIQFTENYLSGICLFNLSSYVKDLKNPIISLNLNPYEDNYGQLLYVLKTRKENYYSREINSFLDGIFVNKLGKAILKQSGIKNFNNPVYSITKEQIENICDTICDWKFNVKKPIDFNKAQVCAGGVYGEEINPNTMESKLVPNLFITGEAVDIHGECGGYNLYFAFASGIIAGEIL